MLCFGLRLSDYQKMDSWMAHYFKEYGFQQKTFPTENITVNLMNLLSFGEMPRLAQIFTG